MSFERIKKNLFAFMEFKISKTQSFSSVKSLYSNMLIVVNSV